MSPLAHVQAWAIEHDDRRSFVWPYFCLSIAAGCFLSLFWLALLIAVHFGMELYRQRTSGGEQSLLRAVWEVKLDVALFLVSLVLSVYMDAAFGVLGLGRAGASAARIGGRIAFFQKAIRPVLLSLDDAFRVVGMVITSRGVRKGLEAAKLQETPEPPLERPWSGAWSWGDRIAVGIGAISVILLAFAPTASGHDLDAILRIVLDEMAPFRVD